MISKNAVYIFDRTICLKMAFYVIWVQAYLLYMFFPYNQQCFFRVYSKLLMSNKTIFIISLITERSYDSNVHTLVV